MTVRDFLREQEYFNSKRWLVNRLLFGSGIVCGLEAAAVGPEPTTVIELQPGVAFDPLGREITVPERARVDLAKLVNEKVTEGLPPGGTGETNLLVCLDYHECPKEPVPSLGGSPCDEVCESNRVGETYTVGLSKAPPDAAPPTPCENWFNRQTVRRQSATFEVERIAPIWVRRGEVFEVALKVTARDEVKDVTLDERATNGVVLDPNPTELAQFPTPPLSLRKGEFFVYVYQVTAPAAAGNIQLSGASDVPTPLTNVQVLDAAQASAREAGMRLGACPDEPSETCVPFAKVRATFNSGTLTGVKLLDGFEQQRFRYNLTRVAELLDCVRASLRAEAESPRPGHAFITFKDLERTDLLPIGPAVKHGESYTVPRGDHVHALLLYNNSGLQFEDNQLRVEGNVGGANINFLNPVSGQDPVNAQHLVTKHYLDSRIAGLEWRESVLTRRLSEPPTDPKEGERYLLPGAPGDPVRQSLKNPWSKHPGSVATFNGRTWDYNDPNEGTAVFVEDENIAYLFVEGKWIQFLATPEVAAGDGLRADGAVLSVGPGPGLKVNPNNVEVVFESSLPSPVGPKPDAGAAQAASRGDHTHALPLAPNGGLAFGGMRLPGPKILPEVEGLYVEGNVGGVNINFLNPVSGQSPTDPRHLATKQYVDGLAAGLDWQNSVLTKNLTAPPTEPRAGARYLILKTGRFISSLPLPKGEWAGHENSVATWDGSAWAFTVPNEGMAVFVEDENTAYLFVDDRWAPFMAMPSVAAGAGLRANGASLSVGEGSGLRVNENDVEVVYHNANPAPVGRVTFTGASPALARGDHTHELPLAAAGGLEFISRGTAEPEKGEESAPSSLRVNGVVNGEEIDFLYPVLGQDPLLPRHLTTKQYVDGAVAGLTWQRTVLDKDLTKPPEPPDVQKGDRYLLFAPPAAGSAWEGHQNHIATWAGRKWDFTAPTEGMAAFVADENLAYLFADDKWVQFLAPPAAVGAGDGLIQKGNDLAVGQGVGVLVTPDAVSVSFGPDAPLPVGTSASAGASRQAAQSDHTHALLLGTSAGLEFVNGSRGAQLRVNGPVGGDLIDFLSPVRGQAPTDPRHLATKQYVDSKGGGAVAAGDGLVNNVNGISVVGGPGLVVGADEVHVNFEDVTAQPVGQVSSAGRSNTVARGDHTHAMPDVWGTSVATGVVAFSMRDAGKQAHVRSLPINPGLGAGAITVVVGLESEVPGEGIFVGEIDHFEDAMVEGGGFRRFQSILLGAVVLPPTGFVKGVPSTTFEIWAQATERVGSLPDAFRVRWWAYRPGKDLGVIDYTPPAPSGTGGTLPTR
jgi:hypothetical protein